MKKHLKEKHPKNIKCNKCDQTFDRNIDLEVHLKTHDNQKLFKCEKCEQNFYLKWRLRKHQEGHENNLKFCHYFNNTLTCPFEEHGCMFLHEISPLCKFGVACSNKCCQFRHRNQETQSCDENDDKNATKEVISEIEDETNYDDQVYPCDTCENVYDDIEELIDHYGETAHNN